MSSTLRSAAFGALACLLIVGTGGCRLKTPAVKPQTTVHPSEDVSANVQQVRLRMRDLVGPFSGVIVEAADRIIAASPERGVRREALLWKIDAVPALRESLFRPNPFMALGDTWVLAWQMIDYFESGHGKEALGDAAPIAVTACRSLEDQMGTIAASMTYSGDVSRAREFARTFAKEHPIQSSIAARESMLSSVTERDIRETLPAAEAAGAVVVTLDDLTRRMDLYSYQLLDQSRWQAELMAMDLAERYQLEKAIPLTETALQSATGTLDAVRKVLPSAENALKVAATAPDVISRERIAALEVLQKEIAVVLQAVAEERIAALDQITKEREAVLTDLHETVAKEHRALIAEGERISMNVVDHVMRRVALLTGVVLLAVFLGAVTLLLITRRLFART